jgi:general secretion pathway protein A
MFLEFYRLQEDPFSLSTAHSLYLGVSHRKALASLHYGIEFGGEIRLLLADRGTGKTTLLRYLQRRTQAYAQTILVSAANCKDADFLNCLSGDPKWGGSEGTFHPLKKEIDEVSDFESETTKRLILLVDDAQELSNAALESLSGLMDLEASKKWHLCIVLAGRPELLEKLKLSNSRRAFSQSWIAPLSSVEVAEYINHRFRLAIGNQDSIFTPAAHAAIARCSAGIPEKINDICVTALMNGAKNRLKHIDAPFIDADGPNHSAFHAVFPSPESSSWRQISHVTWLLLISSFVFAGTAVWYGIGNRSHLRLGFSENEIRHVSAPSPGASAQSAPPANNPEVAGSTNKSTAKSVPVAELRSASATSAVTYDRSITPSPGHEVPGLRSRDLTSARTASTPTQHILRGVAPGSRFRSPADTTLAPSAAENSVPDVRIAAPREPSNIARAAETHQVRVQTDVGDDFMRLGQYEKALSFYEDALVLSPGNDELERKIARARSANATEEQIVPR